MLEIPPMVGTGCIIFSQYYNSVKWLAEQLMDDLPGERIAVYAGSGKSSI
ncbi:MAG: hypothetical protein HZA46_04850 [Planctomycetales bacterium]|nr:hypothetical protein [Planctomycetales bacterium]